MGRTSQETVTTFAEVLSTAGTTGHHQSRPAVADDCLVICFQGMKTESRFLVWLPWPASSSGWGIAGMQLFIAGQMAVDARCFLSGVAGQEDAPREQ